MKIRVRCQSLFQRLDGQSVLPEFPSYDATMVEHKGVLGAKPQRLLARPKSLFGSPILEQDPSQRIQRSNVLSLTRLLPHNLQRLHEVQSVVSIEHRQLGFWLHAVGLVDLLERLQ